LLKKAAQQRIEELKSSIGTGTTSEGPSIDLSAPALTGHTGSLHPITIVRQRIIEIFGRIGYTVSQGPEVEDDHHNFSALNFPPDHPARDMQDTFFVDLEAASGLTPGPSPVERGEGCALRTHTSSVQVRVMESSDPPIRTISPGRVYR